MNEMLEQFKTLCQTLSNTKEEKEKAWIKYCGVADKMGSVLGSQTPEAELFYKLKNMERDQSLEVEGKMADILNDNSTERTQHVLAALDILEENQIYTVNLLGHLTSPKMMRWTLTGIVK